MARRPLLFSVFGSDHTLFEHVDDPRISVRPLADADADVPDGLVLSRPENPKGVDCWRGVPDRVWRSAAAGRTKLVLDASPEGWRAEWVFWQDIHRLLNERGIRAADVAYVTQDRLFEAEYGDACRRAGEAPMHVLVYDYFVQRLAMDLPPDREGLYRQRRRAFEAAGQKRDRIFLNLNYTPREIKLIFLLSLIEQGLWDEGFVSFGGFNSRRDGSDSVSRLSKRMFLIPGFEDLARRLAPHLEALQAKGRITFGLGDDPRKHVKETYRAGGLAEYAMSWFSVVSETEMENRLNRLTEKSFKPLLNFHPMLVLGNPCTLQLVRQYGFQTFDELFDEAYDEVADPRRRFELVFGQVERFCRDERERLPGLVGALSEKLRFNAWHGLVELPKLFRDELQPRLITDLLARWSLERPETPSAAPA